MTDIAPQSLVHRTAPAREGKAPHPALLLLHGRGANEHDLLGLAPLLDPRFCLISPRAPLAMPGGGFQWHDFMLGATPEPVSFLRGLERLRRFLLELPRAYPISPAATFVLGFSQGAAMALALALAEPGAVAGGLLLSGYPPPGVRMEAGAGRPFFVAHGTADPLLPVDFGRHVRDALRGARALVDYHEYPLAHQIGEKELADVNSWLAERLLASPAGAPAAEPAPAPVTVSVNPDTVQGGHQGATAGDPASPTTTGDAAGAAGARGGDNTAALGGAASSPGDALGAG